LLKPAQQSPAKHGFILPLGLAMFKRGHAAQNCSVLAGRHAARRLRSEQAGKASRERLALLMFCF
jgi:hypothetical protein